MPTRPGPLHVGDGRDAVSGAVTPSRVDPPAYSPAPEDGAQEDFFGFTEKPFAPTTQPRYHYRSTSHASALAGVRDAMQRGDGVMAVIGRAGSGKTIFCRALLDDMDRRTLTAVVFDPVLSNEDLVRGILQDFGVVSRDGHKRALPAGVTGQELIETLTDFLRSLVPLGAGALLVVDDAQDLPTQTLEQIRRLSDLVGSKGKLLQVLLVGEPGLRDLLQSPSMRDLDDRVTSRFELEPLSADETAAYVTHGLKRAGGSAAQFEPAALALIHRLSGGIPGEINRLCDRALLGAYGQQTHRITPQLVEGAAAGQALPGGDAAERPVRKPWLMVAIGLIAGAVLVGAYLAMQRTTDAPAAAASQTPAPAAAPTGPAAADAPTARTPAPSVQQPAAAAVPGPPTAVPPAAAAPAATPGASFSVLVASFRKPEEAAALSTELRELGLPVRRVRVVSGGASGMWHQVLVGPYGDAKAAQQGQARVRQIPGYADARVIPR